MMRSIWASGSPFGGAGTLEAITAPLAAHEYAQAHAIAGDLPNQKMEALVTGGDAGERSGLELALHFGDGFLELNDFIARMTPCGASGQFGFKDAPRLKQFAKGDAIDEQ